MKKLVVLALALGSLQAFSSDVFTCKAVKTSSVLLEVSANGAYFGSDFFVKDKSYIPGNNGKQYHRFSNESGDLLVPVLMTNNKTNQGVVILYTAEGKTRFSCLK